MSKLYSVINSDDMTEAYIIQADSKQYHVIFKDLESDNLLPYISQFHVYEDAVKCAHRIARIAE